MRRALESKSRIIPNKIGATFIMSSTQSLSIGIAGAGLLGRLEIVTERHGGLMNICKALSVTVIASLLIRFSCAPGLGAGPCARGRVRVVRGHVTWFPVGC